MSTSPSPDTPAFPAAVAYESAMTNRRLRGVRGLVRQFTRKDLFPEPENLRTFAEDMFRTDPVAERFVDEVYGTLGGEAARALLDQALTDGLDSIDDPPPALVDLFEEFETVPDWVDPELIAEGEAIWRRWGTGLFSVAGGSPWRCTPRPRSRNRSRWPGAMRATTLCAGSWRPRVSGSTSRNPARC